MDEQRPDLPPADERSGEEEFKSGPLAVTAEELAEFSCELAGGALGIAMRDNPSYVMPSEEAGQLVRERLRERFGFDASDLPGYGIGDERPWITKAQAQLIIGVLEEEAGEVIEREDISTAVGALRDVAGLNLSRAQTHDEHEGLAQARQTQSEVD